MPKIDDTPVFSQKDVLDAYKNYDAPDEEKETVLYFISGLTGISVDALSCALDGND